MLSLGFLLLLRDLNRVQVHHTPTDCSVYLVGNLDQQFASRPSASDIPLGLLDALSCEGVFTMHPDLQLLA